jgi:outer membrane protein TolC
MSNKNNVARTFAIAVVAVSVFAVAAHSLAPAQAADDGRTPYDLSLDQALRLALENNLDLVSARMDPEIAQLGVDVERANFDPGLGAGLDHAESKQEISNLFSLNESENDSANVSWAQNLNFGADYRVVLDTGRNAASGPLVTTDTTYGAGLDLTFNMPLLRGFGRETTQESLLLARSSHAASREDLRREAQRVLEGTEGAYWDVLAAQEGLRIARLRLKRAQDLLELNRKRVEVGTLAPIEIVTAEAGVAAQEEGVIQAETDILNAEDNLRALLAVPEIDPMWEYRIVAVDRPDFREADIDLAQSIEVAMEQRAEILNARRTVRDRELSERSAKNRVRPGLDLSVNVRPSGNNFETTFLPGPDGIVGTPDDVTITESVGTTTEAFSEVPKFDNYRWSAGLTFSYPLFNRAAKANYARSQLNRQKAEVALDGQEQAIRVEVRRSVRALESGIKRMAAARANVASQQKSLEAEQKKYENGMSTSFDVLTAQNELADAELSLIRAQLDFVKAKAALERSKGTLL